MKPTTLMLVALGALYGCRDPGPAPEEPTEGASPEAGMPRVDAAAGSFTGAVSERLDAGSYTYLRVNDQWVVTLGDAEPVGAHVKVIRIGVREGFHSRRLDRTFDHLVFGIVRKQESS